MLAIFDIAAMSPHIEKRSGLERSVTDMSSFRIDRELKIDIATISTFLCVALLTILTRCIINI